MRFFVILLIFSSCVSDPSKQARNAYLLEEEDNTLSEVIEDISILLDLYPINGEIDKENLSYELQRPRQYFSSGSNNVGVGLDAGRGLSTGSNNIFIGKDAGRSNSPGGQQTTGSDSIVLGNNDIDSLFCADTSISSSDSRDKTDVVSFNIGLAWIEALRPVTYRWDRRTWYGTDEEPYGTPDGSKKRSRLHIGFLAQEALAVEQANGYGSSNDDSLLVNLTEDGMSYGMKYERLVPILVNAIKELSAKVTALEAG